MAWGAPRAPHPDKVLQEATKAEPAVAMLVTGGVDRAGVEPWYVDHAVKALAARALGDAQADFNLDRLRAEEIGTELVVAKCETLPVMAKRRVVTVSDVDRWRTSEHERLIAYLKRPAPSTTLILSSTRLDRRLAFSKALESLKQVWRFRKLDAPELAALLSAHARKAGKDLDPRAAEEMIGRAGDDLRLLLTELDKLIAFAGDAKRITEEDVAAATAGAGVSDVFAYAEALGRGDLGAALERLKIVLDGGSSAFELIGGLAWHFRAMLKSKAGQPGYIRPEVAAAARAFPTRQLLDAHREIYRADVTLKAAQGPTGLKDEAVMNRLTRRICSLRAT